MKRTGNILRNLVVVAALLMAFSAIANAQATQTATDKVEGYLKDSGFEYKAQGNAVWTIKASTGTVAIGVDGDNLIIAMIVAHKGKFKITAESMSDMLKLAHALDYLKVGIDDDGNLFVRSESKLGSVDGAGFNAALLRIVNGHAKATAKIAPYLVK